MSNQAQRTILFTDLQQLKDAVCRCIDIFDDPNCHQDIKGELIDSLNIVNAAMNAKEPRPSPAVAPGLREAIHKALVDDYQANGISKGSEYYKDSFLITSWDRIADVAATAAAQGGAVGRNYHTEEFRKTLIRFVNEWLWASEFRRTGGQPWDSDYTADAIRMIQDALSKFSAVPAAPGCERVKDAWANWQREAIRIVTYSIGDSHPDYDKAIDELRDAIAALGPPQGSDSQRITDLERLLVDSKYHVLLGSRGIEIVDFDTDDGCGITVGSGETL